VFEIDQLLARLFNSLPNNKSKYRTKIKPSNNNKITISDIESYTNRYNIASSLYLSGALINNIRKIFQPKIIIDPATKLPKYYHEFLLAFDQQETDKFLLHKEYNHKIKLLLSKLLPAGLLYSISEDKLLVLRKFLKKNPSKGFIRASSSPAAFLVLFAKKPGGGFRFCVDYRTLNIIIIKNRHPLPLIQETLACFSRTEFYTKLDVIRAFNRIRITEKQEYFIVFNIYYNFFEILVILFGLFNTLVIFQTRINKIFYLYLDIFYTVYINDILVYLNNLFEYKEYIKKILYVLQDISF
jgi:hypothetical protein